MDYFLNKKLDEDIKRHGKANLEEFMSGKDEDEQDQWLSEEALLSEGPEGDYPTHHFLYNELMDELASNYKRDRINDRKRSDRNNNKMFDSGNDFKFKQ